MTGATLSTGGSEAQGDLTGVGGPGGFATRVGFSLTPFNTRPARPDPKTLGFVVGEAEAWDGAGDFGFATSKAFISFNAGDGDGSGASGASSACGSVIFVPSVHSIDSGAQSSSSSSISAQFACFPGSSDCSLVAKCIPYRCLSSSSVNLFGSGGGAAVQVSILADFRDLQRTSVLIPNRTGIRSCPSLSAIPC